MPPAEQAEAGSEEGEGRGLGDAGGVGGRVGAWAGNLREGGEPDAVPPGVSSRSAKVPLPSLEREVDVNVMFWCVIRLRKLLKSKLGVPLVVTVSGPVTPKMSGVMLLPVPAVTL